MTRALRFHMLDVFTDGGVGGSALVVIEGAEYMMSMDRAAVARRFRGTAAAFLVEGRDPVCAGKLHIHRTSGHFALGEHAPIGAAALLAETRAAEMLARNEIVVEFEEDTFPNIRCEVIRNRAGVCFARRIYPTAPKNCGEAPELDAIAHALRIDRASVGFEGHRPSVFDACLPILFVPVANEEALFAARPRLDSFAEGLGDIHGVYLYTREAPDCDFAIRARMFAAPDGLEDFATAMAAAGFAGVAHEFERPQDGEHQLFIHQGYGVGPRVTLGMTIEAGELTAVSVGGQVARVGEGTLRL